MVEVPQLKVEFKCQDLNLLENSALLVVITTSVTEFHTKRLVDTIDVEDVVVKLDVLITGSSLVENADAAKTFVNFDKIFAKCRWLNLAYRR